VGKSTLALQVAGKLAEKHVCLYVSGEESLEQIKMRATRLKVGGDKLYVVSETLLAEIAAKIREIKPKFVFIDSIQTVYRDDIQSAPGSVAQVRETTAEILSIAKSEGIVAFICGHVTKEGDLAGPRVLEHIVDTVLYFESAKHQAYRILRCFKNRFGSVDEIGIFEMDEQGLKEVKNPSEIFIEEKPSNASGSVVTCVIEGARPILLEIQALVSSTPLPMPRRQFSGVDYNRATIIIAVLEKRLGFRLANQDVFINVVGGIKTNEPACDLAVACSIASASGNFIVSSKTGIIGEVGLTGEVRGVTNITKRVAEFKKLGFVKCIIPKTSACALKNVGIELVPVDTVFDAVNALKQGGRGK
jgi:DNA repair protein RadA/Sms